MIGEYIFAELSVELEKTVVVETLEGEQTFTCEYHGDENVLESSPTWTYKDKAVTENVVKVIINLLH